MKSRLIIVFLGIVLMLTTLLSACSSETKSSSKEPEEILLWSWDADHEKALAAEFMKDHPEIKVKVVPVQDYAKKLKTALATNSGFPDVVQLEENSNAQFIDTDLFEDLSKPPYSMDTSIFPKYLVDRYTDSKGHFIGAPNSVNPAGMFYRRDLAKKYLGTDDPEEVGKLIGAGTDSWDKFIEVGEKLKADSGGKVSLIPGIGDILYMMRKQPDGAWHDGEKLLVNENYLSKFKFIKQIRDRGLDAKLESWSPAWNASFANGTVLFYPGATWFQGFLIEVNDKEGNGRWAVTGNPVANWAWGGSGEAIPKKSKHKEAAFEFIKWWTATKRGAQVFYDQIGAFPSQVDLLDDDYFNQPVDTLGGQRVGTFWKDVLQGIDVPRQSVDDPIANDAISQALKSIDNGSKTPDEAATQMIKDIKEKLKNYK